MAKMNIQIDMSEYLDEAFEEGFQEGFEEGKQRGASEASVRILDAVNQFAERFKAKGRDCLSIDDMKLEMFIIVGHMFKKEKDNVK